MSHAIVKPVALLYTMLKSDFARCIIERLTVICRRLGKVAPLTEMDFWS